jgi:DNA primase
VIPDEVIEQVRDAADIVALIGEHVDLKRQGSDFRGPCPFHGGTHRNFSVVPKKQLYHCFVCHESGDVFTFWMKRFGLDYPTAVREIAGKVGIAVPDAARDSGPDPNEPLYGALAAAADWFARRLKEADEAAAARDLLARRDIPDAVRDDYQLGFAPRGGGLREALLTLGVDEEVQLRCGLLVKRDDGQLAPRFRGRLVFPIADARGRVVGFGGRIIGEGEPKYLNSPETPVFHKGSLLYGLHRARTHIRAEGLAVVVEGYVDCIRLHAAGIGCVVAPLGTALTAEQARVLRRYTRHVALAYDADRPGLKSTFRAGDELLRQGATVAVVTLPPGEDPDTVVLKGGADAFRTLLGGALDLLERKIQLMDRKGLFSTLEGRRRALDRLLPTIRAARDPITRGLYISRAAEKTGVGAAVLEQEVARWEGRPGYPDARRPPAGSGADEALSAGAYRGPDVPPEKTLVSLMLMDEAWVERARREVTAAHFHHPVYRAIASALLAGERQPADPSLLVHWERLSSPPGGEFDAEASYSASVAWLLDRPRRERLSEIDRLIVVAGSEEKVRLLNEKRGLLAAGEARYRRKSFKAELG